ncbi:hypothetical protein Gpo141_00013945, partial [Globisporangium polare]
MTLHNVGAPPNEDETERKVVALVQSWALSRFSKCMARQWILRSLSTTEPEDDCNHNKKHDGNNNNAEDPLLRL